MGKKDSGIDKDLLAFVGGLDGPETKPQAVKATSKSPKTHASHSAKRQEDKVSLADLTAVLDEETGFYGLKKRMENIIEAEEVAGGNSTERFAKVEIVAAPLGSHEQAQLERQAAYELARKEVSKWIPVIRANRQAKNLSFPAPVPKELPTTTEAIVSSFAAQTSLEKSIQAILKKSGMDSEENLIKAEQLKLNKLTPEEVEKRYADLAKKRALLFFTERTSKRQSKIKSKSFRKVVRRERERRVIKETEASGDRLTEEEIREERMKAELERIKERMTLKTRKASKWAHDLMQHRRLEAGSREEVMQLVRDKDRLRQEILGKAAQYGAEFGSGSDLDEDNAEAEHFDDEDHDSATGERQPRVSIKRRRESDQSSEDDELDSSREDELSGTEVDQIFQSHQAMKEATSAPVGRRKFNPSNPLNKVDSLDASEDALACDPLASIAKPAADARKKARKSGGDQAIPTTSGLSTLFEAEDDEAASLDEKTKSQLDMIKLAFAEDQVFAEFEATKHMEVEAEQPKDIDLTLPGWGVWGGEGIAPQKGKIILKSKEGIDPRKRKDAHLRHVIIHEKQAKNAVKLMVAKPPFPFRSREEYEKTLGAPTGKEWNSTLNYTNKIKPRVRVKVGSIIDPIKFVRKDYSG